MFPSDVEMDGFDRHLLVKSDHVRAFVVVGSAEEVSQELHHRRVQLRNVRHILQEEVVDAFIRKYELIELGYHLFQLIVSADLLEERGHFFQSKQYEFAVYCEKHLNPTPHPYFQYSLSYFNICMHTQLQFKPHFQETISDQENTLTNQLSRALTHLNLQRINSVQLKAIDSNQQPPRLSDRKDYLYVCVTGLPPIKNEFQNIGIPGEILMVYPECFQPGTTEEQAKKRFHLSHLETQAANLHLKLKDRTDKPIVFVIHSFGTMIMSTFFRLYYHDYVKRVIGIIPIGAYPIRIEAGFRSYVLWTQSMDKEQMLQNADRLFELQKKTAKQMNFYPCPNKYAFLGSLVAFGHGLGFDDMLVYIRRWFPVLKCFIYGRQDNRIPEQYLNQTAIYYCHKRKLNQEYEERIRSVLKRRYGMPIDNVQQRFIYNIDGGKHSLHTQKKKQPLITNIINEYLSVLEEIVSFKPT